jgi:hypothetical protein
MAPEQIPNTTDSTFCYSSHICKNCWSQGLFIQKWRNDFKAFQLSILVPATSFLDRALTNILASSTKDDKWGVTLGSLHPRKKKKVYQGIHFLIYTTTPQTKAIQQEETPEYSAF